jgi:hypothetical protein
MKHVFTLIVIETGAEKIPVSMTGPNLGEGISNPIPGLFFVGLVDQPDQIMDRIFLESFTPYR